jgi:hypothetical protein
MHVAVNDVWPPQVSSIFPLFRGRFVAIAPRGAAGEAGRGVCRALGIKLWPLGFRLAPPRLTALRISRHQSYQSWAASSPIHQGLPPLELPGYHRRGFICGSRDPLGAPGSKPRHTRARSCLRHLGISHRTTLFATVRRAPWAVCYIV